MVVSMRVLRSATACLATSAILFAVPGLASADEWPVAVLTVQTDDAFEHADSFSASLRRAIEDEPGWRTAQLDKDYALLVLASTLECADPPDAACEEKIAKELKVERFVWGQMKLEGQDVSGDLHYWVSGEPSKVVPFRYSANLKTSGDDTLVEIAKKTFQDLVGGVPPATLELSVGTLDATVLANGQEVGKLKAGKGSVQVPAGSVKLTIRAAGYNDAESTVKLEPREKRELTFTLTPRGAEANVQAILGGTALGLGAVAAGLATWGGITALGLKGEDGENGRAQIQLAPEGSEEGFNGCETSGSQYIHLRGGGDEKALRSFCEDVSLAETLQVALWPTAAVLGGLGIVLLATADYGEAEAVVASLPFTVLPSVSDSGVFVSLQGRLD